MKMLGSKRIAALLALTLAFSCAKHQTEPRAERVNLSPSLENVSSASRESNGDDSAASIPPLPTDDIRRITVADLRESLRRGEAVVVDVRNEAQYRAGHISGARSIPTSELAKRARRELPKNRLIVTYCSCPAEHTSARAASELKRLGFKDVAALRGGYEAWKQAGMPTKEGMEDRASISHR